MTPTIDSQRIHITVWEMDGYNNFLEDNAFSGTLEEYQDKQTAKEDNAVNIREYLERRS